ncbi:MAG: ankyrin repeat domain-containing protein [Planctomycetota bacterium]
MEATGAVTDERSAEVHLGDLRRAVRRGDLEAVRAILDVDPKLAFAASAGGGSLLLEAHEREHAAVAELVRTTRERAGGEALDVHEAAALGRPGAVQRAVTDDPLSAEAPGPAGFLPLHRAAYAGDADCVLLLLQMGADPNAPSENGARLTPLHSVVAGAARAVAGASRAGEAELPTRRAAIRALLAGGADPAIEMEGGWTPRSAADRNGLSVLFEAEPANGDGPAA